MFLAPTWAPKKTLVHVFDLENFDRFLEESYLCYFITRAELYKNYRYSEKFEFGFGTHVKNYIYPKIFIEIGPFLDFNS